MTNNNTSLNLNLTDYTIKKIQMEYHNFAYTGKISTNDLTDSFIKENKVKNLITGNEQIYYISDSEPKQYIEKDKTFFNDFVFFEVIAIDLNKEIPSQAIIKTDVENQDIQNITVIKNTDLKPDLSPSNDNVNTFDYNNIPIVDVCNKLNMKELKTYSNYKTFECFNKTAHTSEGAFRIYNNKKGFGCFGGSCNIKGSNNVELVKKFFNIDKDEAIQWIKENFQNYSNSNDSGTSKQSEPTTQIQNYDFKGRVIDKNCDKKYRLIGFNENEIDKVEITQDIIDKIEIELNKKYSIKTFELLKEFVFIGNGTKTNKDTQKSFTSLRIFTKYGNIIINNKKNVTLICEGLTDFLTCVELYKDNFQDYNFIQRNNIKSHFDFNLTDTNFFMIDSDDNETHIKKLIQESKQDITGKKFYIVEFKQDNIKDLSDYHFKMNFDSNKTKEYIKKNKKELVIIPHLPEQLPVDVTHKQKVLTMFDNKTLKPSALIDYLKYCGYSKELTENEKHNYYLKTGNFFTHTTRSSMIDFISNQIAITDTSIYDYYAKKTIPQFSNNSYFGTLPKFNFNELLKDSKDVINLTFNNCIVEITKDSINIKKYTSEKVLKVDDKDNSINRNFNIDSFNSFTEIDYKNSIAYRFFENIARNEKKEIDNNRLEILQRIIGFYLHNFKNDSTGLAYVLTEFNKTNDSNGGSGKGITGKFLKAYRNIKDISGKKDASDQFLFNGVTKYHNLVILSDLQEGFDVEYLYNHITDTFEVRNLFENTISIPFEISPKLLLTTNKVIKNEGGSSKRRFKEFELSNYYNADFTPYDEFKKELIKDFNGSDWFGSDWFFMQCCQKYLQKGIVKNIENVDINKNRFIEKYKNIGDVVEYLTSFFENEFEYIQGIYEINQNIIRKEVNIYFIDIEVLNLHCKEIFKGSVNNNSIKQFSKFTEMITELTKINFNKNLEIVKKRFGLPSGGQTKPIYSYKVTDLTLHTDISKFIV